MKSIPWDVWIAVAVAIADVLAAVFEMSPALFVTAYVALCGYVVVESFGHEPG